MDTRTRKKIEWYFYNYLAVRQFEQEREQDVIESDLTALYSRVSKSYKLADPTSRKALKLYSAPERRWAEVVEKTYDTYRFELEYELMVDLYTNGKKWQTIVENGVNQSSFWYWRQRWLDTAQMWAKLYGLL